MRFQSFISMASQEVRPFFFWSVRTRIVFFLFKSPDGSHLKIEEVWRRIPKVFLPEVDARDHDSCQYSDYNKFGHIITQMVTNDICIKSTDHLWIIFPLIWATGTSTFRIALFHSASLSYQKSHGSVCERYTWRGRELLIFIKMVKFLRSSGWTQNR